MTQVNQTSKKLHFEKPEILQSEFLACSIPMLSTKVPAAVSIAIACNVPGVVVSMPLAVAY